MAAKLLIGTGEVKMGGKSPVRLSSPPPGSGPMPKPMNRESRDRFIAVLLFVATVSAVVFAGFNFQAERRVTAPDDGVEWVERGGRLVADQVEPNGPGAKAGIKLGDQLISVDGHEVNNTAGLERQLYRTGVW